MGTMTESAKALLPELIKIRRDFHEYPELSGKEEETAKKVAAYLKEMGCDQVIEHVGGYGVIGVIKGASEGGVVALRADMDALQIQEMNETEYKSRNDGVMHACGHDNHMTGLLGAAKLLFRAAGPAPWYRKAGVPAGRGAVSRGRLQRDAGVRISG